MPSSFPTRRHLRFSSAGGWHIGDADVEATLEQWVCRLLKTTVHERRVAELATDLFNVANLVHRLDAEAASPVARASIVHDVGRAICDETHPEDGARLICENCALPLSPAQRRHLVYLTLYHRGSVPEPGDDAVLHASDDHDRLYMVLALLRAADGLDNRALAAKLHTPPHVIFGLTHRSARPSVLHVTCYLEQDSDKARQVYQKRKKFRLLEKALHCDVLPTVVVRGVRRSAA